MVTTTDLNMARSGLSSTVTPGPFRIKVASAPGSVPLLTRRHR